MSIRNAEIAACIKAGESDRMIARRYELSRERIHQIGAMMGVRSSSAADDPWGDDKIERLRALWDEGLSTAEIGRRLHVSKNAVVGKAHRLNLPARPSPIRTADLNAPPKPKQIPRARAATLPPLVTETATMPPTIFSEWGGNHREIAFTNGNRVAVRGLTLTSIQEAVAETPLVARHIRKPTACCWPIGEPGTRGFRFCESEARAGRSYCGDHCSIAYVTARDRQEDAA